MEENPGFILRISSDEWVRQVYDLQKYYSGVMRNWKRGTKILLAKKAEEGDSFIGYGVVEKVELLWEMTPEEEEYCRGQGWRCALTFKPLHRYGRPYPIKESILAEDPRKGSFLHGARLTEDQVDAILEAAEDYQNDEVLLRATPEMIPGDPMSELQEEQKKILKAMTGLEEPAGCKEIGEASDIPWRTVMAKLRGLKNEGYVESPEKGKYVITAKGKKAAK